MIFFENIISWINTPSTLGCNFCPPACRQAGSGYQKRQTSNWILIKFFMELFDRIFIKRYLYIIWLSVIMNKKLQNAWKSMGFYAWFLILIIFFITVISKVSLTDCKIERFLLITPGFQKYYTIPDSFSKFGMAQLKNHKNLRPFHQFQLNWQVFYLKIEPFSIWHCFYAWTAPGCPKINKYSFPFAYAFNII